MRVTHTAVQGMTVSAPAQYRDPKSIGEPMFA